MDNLNGVKLLLPERTKFHFGSPNGDVLKTFSSDKLFSAIINSAALMYNSDSVEMIIDKFMNNTFSISSLFYGLDFIKETQGTMERVKTVYFLPKPYWLIRSETPTETDLQLRKKVKKVKFMSIDVFEKLRASWNDEGKYFNLDMSPFQTISEMFTISKNDLSGLDLTEASLKRLKFMSMQTSQKLQVNRFSSTSDATYYQEELEVFSVQVGDYIVQPFMYFLYRGELCDMLRASVRLLADEGIGGKRSRGLGHFCGVEEVQVPLSDDLTGKYFTSLSTVFPHRSDLSAMESYQLSERNGYIYDHGGTSYRKPNIRVMDEGCVSSSRIQGQIIDVTPASDGFKHDHKILLNGKAFLLSFGGIGI